MNNDKINIVFSINDVYAKFCAVTIASIQSNCKEGINFFYVISKNAGCTHEILTIICANQSS